MAGTSFIVTAPLSGSHSRDPEFGRDALDVLVDTGIRFAVLHGEGRIASGEITSDVDLICDVEFSALIERLAGPFRNAGIRPIVAWPYDTGSTTLFVSNSDATRGAQLDFLWDKTGIGKYGIDVPRLLASVEVGTAYPRVSPLHELLYLARKRQIKEQWEECRQIVDQLSDIPDAATEARHAFVGSVAQEIESLMEGDLTPARPRVRRVIAEAGRIQNRIRRPVGAWVEVLGTERADTVAQAIANRFGGILPHVGQGRRPDTTQLSWLAREVAPVRWRPGLYASWVLRKRRPVADLQLWAADGENHSMHRVVDWLEQRIVP